MRAIEVGDPSQVAEARRAAAKQAHLLGFEEEAAGRAALVATELATNLSRHGGGGALLVGGFDDEGGAGLELLSLDRGAGIENVTASMRDGHSTAGSPGTGLGAVNRGADYMEIYSRPNAGTAILARLGRFTARDRHKLALPAYGAVAVAVTGEDVSGDAWCRSVWDGGWTAMVADGLGHGPVAAEAATLAVRRFEGIERKPPGEVLAAMHAALRPTRGAAVSIAQFDAAAGQVVFAGVGNVAGALVGRNGDMRRMVSNNGTVGHIAKHMRAFTYPTAGMSLLIMASDGLLSGWRLDDYPGLLDCHPTLVAGVLYRDFSRGRDDVTVLVCQLNGP
ncbi:MAG: SpoIIE family protein phosphatase [Acetobacteraceae bacterium]|nr:SpoIIE family protein phosphatase [Acetobacteraceae bacterium]